MLHFYEYCLVVTVISGTKPGVRIAGKRAFWLQHTRGLRQQGLASTACIGMSNILIISLKMVAKFRCVEKAVVAVPS